MEGSKDFSNRICSNELQGEVPYSLFNINCFWRMNDLSLGEFYFIFHSILNMMLYELICCIFE